jgi:diguanylate cyclase (GGDEF)-like protein
MNETGDPEPVDRETWAERVQASLDASTGSVMLLLNANFDVIWASDAGTRRLGGTKALLGSNAVDFVHPDDVELATAAMEHHTNYAARYAEMHIEATPQPSTIRIRDAEGEWVWAEVILHNRLVDPDVGAIVVHLRIDTDRPLLAHAVGLLTDGAELEEVLQALADTITVQLAASTAAIVWWDGTNPKVITSSGVPPETSIARGIAPIKLCKRARRSEQTITVDDMSAASLGADSAMTAEELDSRHVIVIPIEGSQPGDVVATAVVWSPSTVPPLIGKQVPLALTFELVSLAVTDSWLKQRLRADAEADPLTGVFNRAGFRTALSEAVTAGRFPLGVVFLDLDDFKSVNDEHGHLSGDRVLMTCAARLADLDSACSVGRMGGDEFALLTPGKSPEQVAEIAARAVAAAHAPIRVAGEEQIVVPVTAGYASATAPGHVASLLARADSALMSGKRSGKSRAVGDSELHAS